MCMLFVYVNNDATPEEYKVVVASNRDEHLERPTEPAHFWEKDCIGGIDVHPGREGGSWLGMSKVKGIASVLNFPSNGTHAQKGRGFLVRKYLTNDSPAKDYLDSLKKDACLYNSFHLVCLECRMGRWTIHVLSTGDDPTIEELPEGFHVFGNFTNSLDPFSKAVHGRRLFEDIVKQWNDVNHGEELKEDIVAMLSDRTQYFPDPSLAREAPYLEPEHMAERSAICVWSPSIYYGTRTNTVITVTGAGDCEYYERTMEEPIDTHSPKWSPSLFKFNMGLSSML